MKLDLLVLKTPNLEILKNFYSEIFDVEFVLEQHELNPIHYSCKFDSLIFELYQSNRADNITLGLKVKSLTKFEEKLKAKYTFFKGEYKISIKDPDNRLIFISEY